MLHINCSRSACWAGLESVWWHALQYCLEDSTWLPLDSSIGVHGGIQTGKHPLSQSVLCNSAPSCDLTRNHFCACHYLFSGHARPDTTPEPVTASDDKEAFLCVRMEFILTHVHPAGYTSSECIDAPILHNECGHFHEINAVCFWWSPDVGTSLLCIVTGWIPRVAMLPSTFLHKLLIQGNRS